VVKPRREHERISYFHPPNEVGRKLTTPVARASRRLTGSGAAPASPPARSTSWRGWRTPATSGKGRSWSALHRSGLDPCSASRGGRHGDGRAASHAAVICREYGIPAVLNVPGRLRILRDGKTVRVDGENGHVDLC
jgi:hypothetical protein